MFNLYLPFKWKSKGRPITSSFPCSLSFPTSSWALWPRCPLTPERTFIVITCLLFISFSLAQTTWLCSPTLFRSRAWAGPLPHSPTTWLTARAPLRPSCPTTISWVGRAHPLFIITIHTWTVTSGLCYVIHWILPNIGRRAIVADQKVLKISLKSRTLSAPDNTLAHLPQILCTGTDSTHTPHVWYSARLAGCSTQYQDCTDYQI